ncbi:conserved hypothetical protein [Trichinella spiralis]|uniref:hypothetical protein n=1 Tax=Trichinella spiralis TaxID=6334 RepID=UPI0001EFE6AE|nr:conserved hypothetical protein [Trichinella spiralis]
MSFDGSQHRVPVFKRDFLSSLSKEIGSKWPTVPIDDYLSLQKSETNSNQKFKMYHVEDDNNFVLYQCAHKRHSPHGNWKSDFHYTSHPCHHVTVFTLAGSKLNSQNTPVNLEESLLAENYRLRRNDAQ